MGLFLFGLVPCLPLLWCAWRYLRRERAEAFGGRWTQAVGLLGLWTLVASVAQLVAASLDWIWKSTSFDLGNAPGMLVFSWWVLLGGWSVQTVFEETAKDLTGHRRDTMMDNAHYYLALTAVQTLVLALVVAWRWRQPRERSDPLVATVCLLVLTNALAGIAFPYWGT